AMLMMWRRVFASLWALLLIHTSWVTEALRAQAAPWSSCTTLFLSSHFSDMTSVKRCASPLRSLCCSKMDFGHSRVAEIGGVAFVGFAALRDFEPNSAQLDRRRWSMRRGHKRPCKRFTAIPGGNTLLLTAVVQHLSLVENHISWVGAASLHGNGTLWQLHPEHKHISGVPAEAHGGLWSLKTLNLSTNFLETIPTPAIQHPVHLHGNPWRCDCKQPEQGEWCQSVLLQACRVPLGFSPPVTVRLPEGGALTLPCPGQLLYWQTPFGRWQKSDIQDSHTPVGVLGNGSLRVSLLSSHHAGLYYCLLQDSEDHRILSYRLAPIVQARSRKRRGAQGHGDAVPQNQFEVAVAVSVVITFVAGFSLGALSRSFLEHCLDRQKAIQAARGPTVRIHTLPVRYSKRKTFQTAPPESPRAAPHAVVPSLAPMSQSLVPPIKAPQNIWNRQAVGAADMAAMPGSSCQGGCLPAILRDVTEDNGHESNPTVHKDSYLATRGAVEPREEQPQPAMVEPSTHTTRRRVIKLYNYDDDGNPYGHLKDNMSESEPTMRQRSLSLTRLSTIMAAATVMDFSSVSSPPPPQDEDLDSDRPAFQLSI
ncbi:hypothetical protein GN956_G7706, partial [Arapaima gigas]